MIAPNAARYGLMAVGEARTLRDFFLFPALKLAPAKALPIALFGVVCLLGASPVRAAPSPCEQSAEVAVLPSPLAPWKGAPLRVLVRRGKAARRRAVADRARRQRCAPNRPTATAGRPTSGSPRSLRRPPGHGTRRCRSTAPPANARTITRDIAVSDGQAAGAAARRRAASGRCATPGTARRKICIRRGSTKLFDAPLDADLSWKAWHDVLRDRRAISCSTIWASAKTSGRVALRPDCADFVYFLRAYFAFKMGLPFGYSNCSRGAGGTPPKCYQWFDIEHPELTRPAPPPEQSRSRPTPAASAAAPHPNLLQQIFAQQSRPADGRCAGARRPAPPKQLGLAVDVRRNICATSATSFNPARCACRRPTTTPISIWCR